MTQSSLRISAATLLLFVLLSVPVYAIYIPCSPGTGLVDPNKSQPDEKECRVCDVKGCGMCTWDASRCTQCPAYTGPAGTVTDDGASACKKCRSSKCGVCSNGYKKKCTGKVRTCSSKIRKTMSAKKTTVKDIRGDADDTCWSNTQYWAGNGYTSLRVFLVDKKGRCVECQDPEWWTPLETGTNYCWFYEQSLKVMAKAFKKSNCAYPSSIKATLTNQCMSSNRRISFSIKQKFRYAVVSLEMLHLDEFSASLRSHLLRQCDDHSVPSTVGRRRPCTSKPRDLGRGKRILTRTSRMME